MKPMESFHSGVHQRNIQRLIKASLQKVKSDPALQAKPLKDFKGGLHLNQSNLVNEYRVLGKVSSPVNPTQKPLNNSQSRSSGRLHILTPRKRNDSSLSNQAKMLDSSRTAPPAPFQPISRKDVRKPIGKLLNHQTLQRSTPLLQKSFANPSAKGNIQQAYKIEPSRHSQKKNGIIKSYAANTHNGLFRSYNEDRVSIILSIAKPAYKLIDRWPVCSFFAVYDGHGGSETADFLRDNLHLFIIKDENFPDHPELAIERGIKRAEQQFLQHCESSGDRSGSCALVVMFVDDWCYVANVGDSRAIMSCDRQVVQLTRDHKPQDDIEKRRVEDAGGYIYQQSVGVYGNNFFFQGVKFQTPHRVYPGKLSVCRTIGDFEAKNPLSHGNPKVVICDPDIYKFQVTNKHDYILMASDGIFDRLSTEQVNDTIWNSFNSSMDSIHLFSGQCLEQIFYRAFDAKTLDNVTAVIIGLKGLKKSLFSRKANHQKSRMTSSIIPGKPIFQDQTTLNLKLIEMRRRRTIQEQKTL